jgi:hypothetical protein
VKAKSTSGVEAGRHQSPWRLALGTVLIGLATAGLQGCIAVKTSAPKPAVELSGVWKGESLLTPCGWFGHSESVCNAMNLITFTLIQSDSKLSGRYTCAYGNYVCRHGGIDRSGYITSGRVSGQRMTMRVMIPADVSSCLFSGTFAEGQIAGRYTCYEGGGIAEEGDWRVVRVY